MFMGIVISMLYVQTTLSYSLADTVILKRQHGYHWRSNNCFRWYRVSTAGP